MRFLKGIVFTFRNKQKTIPLPSLKRHLPSPGDALTKYGFQTVFIILFVLGLAVGAASGSGADGALSQKLDFLFITNIEARLKMTAFDIFLSCFASYFLFIFATLLCAVSVWGFSLIPFLALVKGFSVGLSSAVIFAFYQASGIGFYILIVLPGAVLFLFVLIRYSKISFRLSMQYFRLSFFGSRKVPALSRELKSFLKKSAYTFLSAGACAVIDMLLWILFANHFEF